jgi:ERCC4-type nuclease
MNLRPTILCDSREPWPSPWRPFWLPDVPVLRATLETGDYALAGATDGAVIERKTVPDLLACIGRERDRFTRELLRARFCASFCIVVEGSLLDVFRQARAIHPSSIMGTLAAWTRRGFYTRPRDNRDDRDNRSGAVVTSVTVVTACLAPKVPSSESI